jgi:hypothetical protein
LTIRHRAIDGTIKKVHHRDTEARRSKKKRYLFFTCFSVPLCPGGGSSLLATGGTDFSDGQGKKEVFLADRASPPNSAAPATGNSI